MRALAMVTARDGRAIFVDGKFYRLAGDRFEMTARAELDFAVAEGITMLIIAWDQKIIGLAPENFFAQVTKDDAATRALAQSINHWLQAGLPAHQRPIGPLQRTIGDQDRFRVRKIS